MRSNPVPYSVEYLQFKAYALLLRPDNLLFHFLQFRSHEAFGVCQRLLAYIAFGNLSEKAPGYLNVIAENFVELYAKISDSCFFAFFCFQIKDPFFTIFLGFPVFIQDFRISVPDNPSLSNQNRGIRMNCFFQQTRQVFHRIQCRIYIPDF